MEMLFVSKQLDVRVVKACLSHSGGFRHQTKLYWSDKFEPLLRACEVEGSSQPRLVCNAGLTEQVSALLLLVLLTGCTFEHVSRRWQSRSFTLVRRAPCCSVLTPWSRLHHV